MHIYPFPRLDPLVTSMTVTCSMIIYPSSAFEFTRLPYNCDVVSSVLFSSLFFFFFFLREPFFLSFFFCFRIRAKRKAFLSSFFFFFRMLGCSGSHAVPVPFSSSIFFPCTTPKNVARCFSPVVSPLRVGVHPPKEKEFNYVKFTAGIERTRSHLPRICIYM